MVKFNIWVKQNIYKLSTGEIINEYHFGLGNGLYLGYLRFPGDMQLTEDNQALELMCKPYALRWRVINIKRNK